MHKENSPSTYCTSSHCTDQRDWGMTALCVSRVCGLKSNTILITCIQILSQMDMYFVSSLRFKENPMTHIGLFGLFVYQWCSSFYGRHTKTTTSGDVNPALSWQTAGNTAEFYYIWSIFLFLFGLIKNFKMRCDHSSCTFLSQMLHLAALLSKDASMFH